MTELSDKGHQAIGSGTWRLITWAIVFAGMAVNLWCSYRFFLSHVYYYHDTLFDTDPDLYSWLLLGHSHLARRHPLMALFALPFSTAGAVLSGITGKAALRWWIPILFGPLVSGCRTFLLMSTMRRLQLPLRWTSLVLLIEAFSLSRLVMGSEPESFGLSATVFCCLFLLAADFPADARFPKFRWIIVGVFLGGTTITNIVPWAAVLLLILLAKGPWRSAFFTTAKTAALAALLMASLYGIMKVTIRPEVLSRGVYGGSGIEASAAKDQTDAQNWILFQPGRMASTTPLLDTYVFAGPLPRVEPAEKMQGSLESLFPEPRPEIRFWLPEKYSLQWLPALIPAMLALVLGTAGWLSRGETRVFGLANLLVIAFQFTLHTFWGGGELYLYSMHWQASLVLLVAGGWKLRGNLRYVAAAAGMFLLGVEIVLNFRNLQFIFAALQGA